MSMAVINVEELWARYTQHRDTHTRNQLVEYYSTLVRKQAARLARKLPNQIGYDEICSAGYDGLIEAVEAFDPQRNIKFETFCQQRIVGAVMDWLRSLDHQSRTVRDFEKQRYQVQEALDAELGRPPTHDETANYMGISLDRYNQLTRLSQLGREIHFSTLTGSGGAEGPKAPGERTWDIGDPHQQDPSDRMNRLMVTDYITRGLTRDERLVLILYYHEELTMAEIGLVLSLSESRVSQIHKDVLERLRKRFANDIEREQLVA